MVAFQEIEGHCCEVVKWHTRKKHVFLEEYLKIWTQHVGKKGQSVPTLDIVDLFASSGWCYCGDLEECDSPTSKAWKGSALLSAKYLNEYKRPNALFLNTYNSDPIQQEQQLQSLERETARYDRINRRIITNYPIETAVDEAIQAIDPNYPSLWLLDPYNNLDLPWEIIQKICETTGGWIDRNTGKEHQRRPELLITLMTHSLTRNINTHPGLFSKALGIEEEVWRPRYNDLIAMGNNSREAIIKLFLDRLSGFYERTPVWIEVNDTRRRAIIYSLILCTDSPAGNYVMKQLGVPKYEEWRVHAWNKDAEVITAVQAQPEEQKTLSSFY